MSEEIQQVARAARKHLSAIHPGGSNLDIIEARIRRDESVWRVPVQPDYEPPKLYEYYEELGRAEDAIFAQENIRVFLVPAEPKAERAA